jgi:hypothetical protein
MSKKLVLLLASFAAACGGPLDAPQQEEQQIEQQLIPGRRYVVNVPSAPASTLPHLTWHPGQPLFQITSADNVVVIWSLNDREQIQAVGWDVAARRALFDVELAQQDLAVFLTAVNDEVQIYGLGRTGFAVAGMLKKPPQPGPFIANSFGSAFTVDYAVQNQ